MDGKVVAKEFKVTLSNWGDFVLRNDYPIMSLAQVSDFISEYGHLPGIPSEKQIMEEDGFDLGNMAYFQQIKIEELYLYAIEQQKTIENLMQQYILLQKRMEYLEKK